MPTAAKVVPREASRTVVEPIEPAARPSERRRRGRPRTRPRPAAGWRTGSGPRDAAPRGRRAGPAAARRSAARPGRRPCGCRPVTASDGIHDTVVTDDSTRMSASTGSADTSTLGARRDRPKGAARWLAARHLPAAVCQHPPPGGPAPLDRGARVLANGAGGRPITVFLADDNLIVREGVRALLGREPDLEVVGVADDYDELVDRRRGDCEPQVLVTDIRMPPNFQNEGIEAAKEVRKRHPGTGVVVLSQYDDPEYAISPARRRRRRLRLPAEGPRRRRRPARPRDPRGRDRRLDARPRDRRGARAPGRRATASSTPTRRSCCARSPRAGRSRRSPPPAETTPEAVNDAVEQLFLELAKGASAGAGRARCGGCACCTGDRRPRGAGRDAQPAAARRARREAAPRPGRRIGETERLDVTVLMSDVRGYSAIAEHADPAVLARPAQRRTAPR